MEFDYPENDWEDEQYENGYHPERIYTEHTESELGRAFDDAVIEFDPGTIQLYAGARRTLERANASWQELVVRHLQGDFGDETDTQVALNRLAIERGAGSVVLSKHFFGDEFVEIQTDLEQNLTKIT